MYSLTTIKLKTYFTNLAWGKIIKFTRKLLNDGMLVVKLNTPRQKFYGRHRELFNHYWISMSQIDEYVYVPLKLQSRPFICYVFSPICSNSNTTDDISGAGTKISVLKHLSSPRFLCDRSLVFVKYYVDFWCLCRLSKACGHCNEVSSLYDFWLLPLVYNFLLMSISIFTTPGKLISPNVRTQISSTLKAIRILLKKQETK